MANNPNRIERMTLSELLLVAQILAILGGLAVVGFRAGQLENRLTTAIERLGTTRQSIAAHEARIDDNASRIQKNEVVLDEHGRRIHSLEEKVK